MDGAGADEAKISQLLETPYLFEGLSVVLSTALSWQVLRCREDGGRTRIYTDARDTVTVGDAPEYACNPTTWG